MDDPASHRRGAHSDDLAALVLGRVANARDGATTTRASAHVRAAIAPERVPVDARPRAERGHDARSVAVLALVVAVLAALGGWLTSVGADPAAPAQPAATLEGEVDEPASADVTAGAAAASPGTVPAAARGVDLAVGRVVASRTEGGIGSVAVGVTNAGSRAYGGRAGANLLLLLDGDVVATKQVPRLEPGADARLNVPLGWCPAGAVAVTAVLDASAAVREGDERNNATTRSLDFSC